MIRVNENGCVTISTEIEYKELVHEKQAMMEFLKEAVINLDDMSKDARHGMAVFLDLLGSMELPYDDTIRVNELLISEHSKIEG